MNVGGNVFGPRLNFLILISIYASHITFKTVGFNLAAIE